MTTAVHTTTTSLALSIIAVQCRALAAEADIAALVAVRTDAETIQRTEASYRGLVVKQDRYRRLARQLARQLEVAQ